MVHVPGLSGRRFVPTLGTATFVLYLADQEPIQRGKVILFGGRESGAILTRLRLALKMLFTGRTHFFRDNAQRKFRGFS